MDHRNHHPHCLLLRRRKLGRLRRRLRLLTTEKNKQRSQRLYLRGPKGSRDFIFGYKGGNGNIVGLGGDGFAQERLAAESGGEGGAGGEKTVVIAAAVAKAIAAKVIAQGGDDDDVARRGSYGGESSGGLGDAEGAGDELIEGAYQGEAHLPFRLRSRKGQRKTETESAGYEGSCVRLAVNAVIGKDAFGGEKFRKGEQVFQYSAVAFGNIGIGKGGKAQPDPGTEKGLIHGA